VALGCTADWQSAGVDLFRKQRQWLRLAESHSAKQQAASLRYKLLHRAAVLIVVSSCARSKIAPGKIPK